MIDNSDVKKYNLMPCKLLARMFINGCTDDEIKELIKFYEKSDDEKDKKRLYHMLKRLKKKKPELYDEIENFKYD